MEKEMKEKLAFLRADKAKGEVAIGEIDRKRQELVEAVLRIDGAIILLEEFLAPKPAEATVP